MLPMGCKITSENLPTLKDFANDMGTPKRVGLRLKGGFVANFKGRGLMIKTARDKLTNRLLQIEPDEC